MIKIYRFSLSGFEPQYQKHLFDHSKITLDSLLNTCTNEYMKNLITKSYIECDPDFEYYGVFVFLKEPSFDHKRFYLNHLKVDLKSVPMNVSLISDTSICYIDDGFVQRKTNKTTIKEAFDLKHEAVYIPQSQLKLLNI